MGLGKKGAGEVERGREGMEGVMGGGNRRRGEDTAENVRYWSGPGWNYVLF